MRALTADAHQGRIHIDARSGIPDVFKDLDPQYISSDGQRARLHLSGCGDDKVLLVVEGLGDGEGKKITLLPGEAARAILLWKSD